MNWHNHECSFCGTIVPNVRAPAVDNDSTWKLLASWHDPECKWVRDRGQEDVGECESCSEILPLFLVYRVGWRCKACHDEHPLTIARARADMMGDDT